MFGNHGYNSNKEKKETTIFWLYKLRIKLYTLFFIRTSIFRVETGLFLFSGQFQQENVLTNVLKFQSNRNLPAFRRLLFPLFHVQQRKQETSARRQTEI